MVFDEKVEAFIYQDQWLIDYFQAIKRMRVIEYSIVPISMTWWLYFYLGLAADIKVDFLTAISGLSFALIWIPCLYWIKSYRNTEEQFLSYWYQRFQLLSRDHKQWAKTTGSIRRVNGFKQILFLLLAVPILGTYIIAIPLFLTVDIFPVGIIVYTWRGRVKMNVLLIDEVKKLSETARAPIPSVKQIDKEEKIDLLVEQIDKEEEGIDLPSTTTILEDRSEEEVPKRSLKRAYHYAAETVEPEIISSTAEQERLQMLRTIINRTLSIELERLLRPLKFKDVNILVDWLYGLPEEWSFTIDKGTITFADSVKDEMDELLKRYEEMEATKRGKR